MTRILLVSSSLLMCALSAGALWALLSADQSPPRLAVAVAIVNIVAWPLALVVAYRIGQITAAASLKKGRHSRAGH